MLPIGAGAPMSNLMKELGSKSLTRTTRKEESSSSRESLRPPQIPLPATPTSPQSRPQMPLPPSVQHKLPNMPLPPTPDERNAPTDQASPSRYPTKALKMPLPPTPAQSAKPKPIEKPFQAPPKPKRSKSNDELGKNDPRTSPVPRPRNRPPPPPAAKPSSEDVSAVSNKPYNRTASESDALNKTWGGRPKPAPRARPRRPDVMSDEDRLSSQDSLDEYTTENKFISKLNSTNSGEPRRSSFPATATTTHRPTPPRQGSPNKPKPPAKPALPRKPGATTTQGNKKLSPQALKIIKLSEDGLGKVYTILDLSGAREGESLTELVHEFQELTLRVKESLSSLTDTLAPQARFKFRRTVTDFDSKYNDLDSVIQTVGRNLTSVDMERINKVAGGVAEGLDEVCSTLKAMGT